ncbi:hypothetical protein LTR39_003213, partial [Cryomyces antarcticus]
ISHSFPRARTVKRENPDDPDGNALYVIEGMRLCPSPTASLAASPFRRSDTRRPESAGRRDLENEHNGDSQPQITLEPRLAGDRLGLTSQRDEFRTRGAGMVDTARDDNVRCTPLAQDPAAWSAAAKREYPGTNSGSGTPSRLFAGPQPSGHPLPTLQQGRAQRPTGRSMNGKTPASSTSSTTCPKASLVTDLAFAPPQAGGSTAEDGPTTSTATAASATAAPASRMTTLIPCRSQIRTQTHRADRDPPALPARPLLESSSSLSRRSTPSDGHRRKRRKSKQDERWWEDANTPFKEFARAYSSLKIDNGKMGMPDTSGDLLREVPRIDILAWQL